MASERLTIALAGNPNSGKTTIFNRMTGTRQKVGNWPGVTVEKKEGTIHRFGRELKIIDLPGTYSLTPFSIEEIVARNFILDESPDVVIDIIDASNLERSLYLATQLRELDCRLVYALNMADLARARGSKIDADKLAELLDVPVVFTVGNKGEGIEILLETAVALARSEMPDRSRRRVKYSQDIETAIAKLRRAIESDIGAVIPQNPRWIAVKLLEDDKIIRERLLQTAGGTGAAILKQTEALRDHLRDRFDDDPEIVLTDERYGFIAGVVKEVLTTTRQRIDLSRTIDLVLTHRFFGFPIFIFFIWAMFELTFTLGEYPMRAIDASVGWISGALAAGLPPGIFKELLLEGVVAGVGSVVVFLPNILILFFCIALFEDTGYMARSAFLMDKIMHLIGLHGKSFIPMLMGFGCNVPAIMATRTLESEKDRILTILITPFMSCSAKLPVYVVLAGTFFGRHAGTVIFCVYLTGIALSMISGRIFRSTLLRGADAPFVMELPPYRVPMLKSLLIHMWDRSKIFLRKMGGVILIGSIVIWSLSAFPRAASGPGAHHENSAAVMATIQDTALPAQTGTPVEPLRSRKAQQLEQSFMGRIGKALGPVFAPLGIDWRGGVSLVSGFVAKEIVVSTMGVLYATEDDAEAEVLRRALKDSDMTRLSALSMMIFVLLYLPCLATVGAIRRETGSVKWMMFSIVYSTSLAWLMAFAVYQGGKLLGFQ
ncbi:MAG TPA: ferrous iron transport protein B [Desulfobacterales bacterium]